MEKFADRYLAVQPWGLEESGFHADRARVSESLFSQANEAMGVRAAFEEGYTGDTLPGSYVSGVFEELVSRPTYRGVSHRVCFMVNAVDWSHLRLTAGGERLDLAKVAFEGFRRTLDFRSGLLVRTYDWKLAQGGLRLTFERLVSMDAVEWGFHRLTVQSLGWSGTLTVVAGLDFGLPHEVYHDNFWTCDEGRFGPQQLALRGVTKHTRQALDAGMRLRAPRSTGWTPLEQSHFAGFRFSTSLSAGEVWTLERDAVVCRTSDAKARLAHAPFESFDQALEANRRAWADIWSRADVEIEGDAENQQGIRFSIFQLEQTFRGRVPGSNIGAKGLSGEFYNGNYFWDSEIYCLPYYLYKNPSAARALLDFRYDTLPQALERARELDCEGACYPVATIDGTESCTLWQHASLQFQPTTGVAYALRQYWKVTGDDDFLVAKGLEMFVHIGRFLASRCQFSPRKGAWGFYAVMGPDEFQMMVNHNAYTNVMGARSLEHTLEALAWADTHAPTESRALQERLGVTAAERQHWAEIAGHMFVPVDAATGVIEQHEGFFDLPHVDIKSIPVTEFPLYHHWSYDRIYRNDMIKQPDVLLLQFLHNRSYTEAEKRANYEFYEPRTIHESSLSPSVHSILATELGKHDEALGFFRFATRIDLDNYNRNTNEGLHLTAIAGAWMNIVYGFAGWRTDGERPRLAPVLPPHWTSYAVRLLYRGSRFLVRVSGTGTVLTLEEGPPLELDLFEQRVVIR